MRVLARLIRPPGDRERRAFLRQLWREYGPPQALPSRRRSRPRLPIRLVRTPRTTVVRGNMDHALSVLFSVRNEY